MTTLSCLLVDDEPVARKILQRFVDRIPFLHSVGQLASIDQLEQLLPTTPVDLLFLDIEMPKRTGLDYLKSSPVKPMVILTTAFAEYALTGYELDILDYLLKPIGFDRFEKAVQKAQAFAALRATPPSSLGAPYLFIRRETRFEKVELADILYVESQGNSVLIHTLQGSLGAYLTLKSLEQQLPSPTFLKIHQSFLVNMAHIRAIEGHQIWVQTKRLPISRPYRTSVMNWVEPFLMKR